MPRDLHYRLCAQVLGFALPMIIKQKGKQLQAKAWDNRVLGQSCECGVQGAPTDQGRSLRVQISHKYHVISVVGQDCRSTNGKKKHNWKGEALLRRSNKRKEPAAEQGVGRHQAK